MNDILKQRLVGALILVALGVVFWPIIFVEPGDTGAGERPNIPRSPAVETHSIEPPDLAGLRPSPELSVTEIEPEPAEAVVTARPEPEPVPAVNVESVESAAPVPAPAPEKAAPTRAEPPVKPKIDKDGVPIAWILQVASVSSQEKADELRERLLEMNQKAYIKKVKRNGKTLYRVYVGPKYEKAKLDPLKIQIDKAFSVQSMIVRYFP